MSSTLIPGSIKNRRVLCDSDWLCDFLGASVGIRLVSPNHIQTVGGPCPTPTMIVSSEDVLNFHHEAIIKCSCMVHKVSLTVIIVSDLHNDPVSSKRLRDLPNIT